jgi:N-sulfoglucosamine sulfohydrolase
MRAVQTKQFLYIFNPWSNGTRVFATATTGTSSYRRLAALAKTDASLAKRLEIYQHRVVEEMYDVAKDPACLHNLINEKKYEAVIEQQRQRLLAWMEKTNDHMLPMYRNRKDADAREAYVVAMEAASSARGSKNKKPKPQGPKPVKKDVFNAVFPKEVTAATTVEYSLKHDVPQAYGKVGLTITLKQGNKGARVERREITVEGKGMLVVKFEIPSNPTDGKVSFAIWAGEDFENKLQYLHSQPVTVKYLDD